MAFKWISRLLSVSARKRLAQTKTKRGRSIANSFFPRIDILEDRLAPATVRWSALTGGDWSLNSNWTHDVTGLHQAPTQSDDAIIDILGGDFNVTISGFNAAFAQSLDCKDVLSLNGGSLTINQSANNSIEKLVLSTGTLAGTGTVTVATLDWLDGTMSGAGGKTRVTGSATFRSNNSKVLNSRTLELAGNSTWSEGGWFKIQNSGVIVNQGVFDVQSNGRIVQDLGTGGIFINTATFRKSARTDETGIYVAFANSGSVDVQIGSLTLYGGGTSTGIFTASAAGATCNFGGGTHNLNAGSLVSGIGTIGFTGSGTTNINGSYAVAGITRIATGALVNFNVATSITSLTIDSNGLLAGASTVTVTTLNWISGTMSGVGGKTRVTGTATFSSNNSKFLNSRTLELTGSSTWTDGGWFKIQNSGVIVNQGVFDVQSNGRIVQDLGTGGVFNNSATFRKSARTDEAGIYVSFVNSGSLDIQVGLLRFYAGGSNIGRFQASGSGKLQFDASTFGGADQSVLTGAGEIKFLSAGSQQSPQTIEAKGQDRHLSPGGFFQNKALGKLWLSGGYYKLTDLVDHAGDGATPDAIYVNDLEIDGGTTLDLTGVKLYYRVLTNAGTPTYIGGSPLQVADGGTLDRNVPASGTITSAVPQDDWTFYGRTGEKVTVLVHPGSSVLPASFAPFLGFAEIQVYRTDNNQLITSLPGTTSGQPVTISDIQLPTDTTYQVRVKAPSGQASATGNYVVTVFGQTISTFPLVYNQTATGTVANAQNAARGEFYGVAGDQLAFDVLAATPNAIFTLTGPTGAVFTAARQDVATFNLQASGSYVLTVNSDNASPASYSFKMVKSTVTTLTLGVPWTGALGGTGDGRLFQIDVPQGSQLRITQTDGQASNRNELYLARGFLPTRAQFEFGATGSSANQTIIAPSAPAGSWYILLFPGSAAASASVSILAEVSAVLITAVTPDRHGTSADLTMTLSGAGFMPDGTTVALVSSGGQYYTSPTVEFNTDQQVTAVFPASSVPIGAYSVRVVVTGGFQATLPNAIQLTSGSQVRHDANLTVPNAVGRQSTATLSVEYQNTGDLAQRAPLLILRGIDPTDRALLTLEQTRFLSGARTSAMPDGFSDTIQILGSGKTAGRVQPGEHLTLNVYYAGLLKNWDLSDDKVEFRLSSIEESNTEQIDWNAQKSTLRPSWMVNEAWDVVFDNLVAGIGSTWGSYVRMLNDNAEYLGKLGRNVTDVSELWSFEVLQAIGLRPVSTIGSTVDIVASAPGMDVSFGRAYYPSLDRRFDGGVLGKGWRHNWQWSVQKANSATGTIVDITTPSGYHRRFFSDSRPSGGYLPSAGDHAVLTDLGAGRFQLRELDGTILQFRSDGQLDFLQDAAGNRITAAYTSGLLTRLTQSSGAYLALAYVGGKLATVSDAAGRAVNYSVDPSTDHLKTTTTFGRTVSYDYDPGTLPAKRHALTTITDPAGLHTYFAYDSHGRLSSTESDGGQERRTFAYGPAGSWTMTDATSVSSQVFVDQDGQLAKLQNSIGQFVIYLTDENGRVNRVSNTTGLTWQYEYDNLDNVVLMRDPLGNVERFQFGGPFNRLLSNTDASGTKTNYSYDVEGNIAAIMLADGSIERYDFDGNGNSFNWTNRRGRTVQYVRDQTTGLLRFRIFADGSQIEYRYDARGRLWQAIDSTGTTTFTYRTDDLLDKMTLPDGKTVEYGYYADGRRQFVMDQTGFKVQYFFDSAGRLEFLRNGQDQLLVRYQYDAAGRIAQKTFGNGAVTRLHYNTLGQNDQIEHFDASNSRIAFYFYSFDSNGRIKVTDTNFGTWNYKYDRVGQLIEERFTTSNAALIPSRLVTYEYDASGNRLRVVEDGVVHVYQSNYLNQLTSVDGASYEYDRDGNLVRVSGFGMSRQYSYDDENQLVTAVEGTNANSIQRDPFGHIRSIEVNAIRSSFVNDLTLLFGVFAEYGNSGQLSAHYIQGSGLEQMIQPNGSQFSFAFDSNGNTSVICGNGGSISNRYVFDSFGRQQFALEGIAPRFKFGGQFSGIQVGSLSVFGLRPYEAALGRFVVRDPLGRLGGDTNPYRYVHNDAPNKVDPFGLTDNDALEVLQAILGHVAFGLETAAILAELPVLAPFAYALGSAIYAEQLLDLLTTGFAMLEFRDVKPPEQRPGEAPWMPKPIPDQPPRSGANDEVPGGPTIPGGGNKPPGMPSPQPPPIPTPPDGKTEDEGTSDVPESRDPNQKIAGRGYGADHFVKGNDLLAYRIDFENDSSATAPAQSVIVLDQLDGNLDLDYLTFTEFAFGDTLIVFSVETRRYKGVVEFTVNGKALTVEVELGLNTASRQLYAVFQTIDPATGLPPDVFSGFLAPEDGSGRGQGHFSFTIRPRTAMPTGTRIKNVASITFDGLETIATNQIDPHNPAAGTDPEREAYNTIDVGGPTSTVDGLPATTTTSQFTVSWSGQDDAGGAGIAYFDIYVSDNNGAYTVWQSRTPSNSASFLGVNGHTYRFYSVATDGVGHVQPTPGAAQATTTLNVAANDPPVNQIQSIFFGTFQNTFTNWVGWMSISDANSGSSDFQVTLTVNQGILTVSFGQPGGVVSAQVTGNNTANVVITAPLAAINATFAGNAGIRFTPTTGFTGNITFTMTTNDQFPGNSITDTDQVVFPVYANASEISDQVSSGNWATVQNGGTSTVGWSAVRAHYGLDALYFNTSSGGLAGPLYKPNGGAHWDLRDKTHLIFWEYGINDNSPLNWQGYQPKITVYTATGSFTLTRQQEAWPLQTWVYYEVPLTGDGLWPMSDITGTPTLDDVLGIEILHDTWGSGFTVYLDGVAFVRKTGVFANQAPTFASGLSLRLNDLTTNPTNNIGTMVSQILASSGTTAILDADGNSLRGIAVTAVNNTNGNWQYSVDGGVNWVDLSDVNTTYARLLSADSLTRVRFVPNANFAGTVDPGITFVAWDRTFGTAGRAVNVTTRGGGTAYSQSTQSAKITVVAPNSAPVNTIDADLIASLKDTIAQWGGWLSIADANAGSSTLQLTLNVSQGSLLLATNVSGGVVAGQVTGNNSNNVVLTATLGAINATLAASQGVRFTPAPGYAGNVTFTMTTNDQFGGGPLSDVDQVVLPIYGNAQEITEGNLAFWSTVQFDGTSTVANNTSFVRQGSQSLWFSTTSGGMAGPLFKPNGGAHWDLRDKTHLLFWEYGINGTSGWEFNQPKITVYTAAGSYTLTRQQSVWPLQTWVGYEVPLNGDPTVWIKGNIIGSPSLTDVLGIDIQHDTLDFGFGVYFDGVAFVRKTGSFTNQAPTIVSGLTLRLDDLAANPTSNVGNTVAQILASGASTAIQDADGFSLRGIAITSVNNANGAWQYSLDGGASWSNLAGVGVATARLLSADSLSKIRFVPNANFVGTVDPGITFVAWDRTFGTAGLTADVTTRGGTTAFSTATLSARIAVVSPNSAPVNSIQASLFAAFKSTTANWGGWIDVTDANAGTGNFQLQVQVSSGTVGYDVTVAGGVSSSQVTGANTSLLTFTAPLSAIQNTLRSARGIFYSPAAGFTGNITFTITASDLFAGNPLSDTDSFAFPVYDATENLTDNLTTGSFPWTVAYQANEPNPSGTLAWVFGGNGQRQGGTMLALTTNAALQQTTRVNSAGIGRWDIRDKTHLVFWERPQNSNTFEGFQPVVKLISATGTLTLTRQQVPASGLWILQEAPLTASNADWNRSILGTPDLSNITSIEILHDTLGSGFTMWIDGMAFVRKSGTTTNVAPTFANVNSFSLGTRYSAGSSVGMLVADLITSGGSGAIADGNGSAMPGIAIIAANATNGTWSYSLDNGTTWQSLNGQTATNARLLAADGTSRIRFTPNPGFVGTIDPGITFVAWDRTFGVAGMASDASVRGGTSAFSTSTRSARIRVLATSAAATGNTLARDASTGNWWDVSASPGETNKFLGAWSTSGNWVDILTADFNGDGQEDIAGRDAITGNWQVSIVSENVFSTSVWTKWTVDQNPPAVALHWVDVRTGDFNKDGIADIAGRWLETGQWWVNISTGTGFVPQYWGAWTGTNAGPGVTWVDVQSGDINGDGRLDIVGRWQETGQWWIASSNSALFTNVYFASWTAPYFGVTWVDSRVIDLNSDGKSDIIGRWLEGGQWWAAMSNGLTGTNVGFATWGRPSEGFNFDSVRIGDFDGDGRGDIVGRRVENGDLWVGLSNGSSLTTSIWGRYESNFSWSDIAAADFDGDGKTDLRARRTDGRLRTNQSTSSAFSSTGVLGDVFSTSWSQFVTIRVR